MGSAVKVERFPFLIDAPEDGGLEATGWLPVAAAATAEDAVTEFVRRYQADVGDHPLVDRIPGETLLPGGREFHLAHVLREVESETVTDRCVNCDHRKIVHSNLGCTMSLIRGDSARPCGCSSFEPVTLYETDEVELFGDDAWAAVDAGEVSEEQIRYRKCQAGTAGAEEFWRIDVAEGCGSHVHENDDGDLFFCAMRKGHEGRCVPDTSGLPVVEFFELQLIGDHDWLLSREVEKAVRAGARIAGVRYMFPEVTWPRRTFPNGDPIPSAHREHTRRFAYRQGPRALVSVDLVYENTVRTVGAGG